MMAFITIAKFFIISHTSALNGFCSKRILFNGKLSLMSNCLGTNAVIVKRFHCICNCECSTEIR